MEEYNKSYGANNHTSLLSHAQSQSILIEHGNDVEMFKTQVEPLTVSLVSMKIFEH